MSFTLMHLICKADSYSAHLYLYTTYELIRRLYYVDWLNTMK